jgi:hypothetical protein
VGGARSAVTSWEKTPQEKVPQILTFFTTSSNKFKVSPALSEPENYENVAFGTLCTFVSFHINLLKPDEEYLSEGKI